MDSPRSIQLAHPAKEPASKRAARDRASFFLFFTVFLLENNGECCEFFQLFIYVFLLKIGSQLKFLYSMKIKEQTRKLAAGCT
ncbi:hypothetical protein CYK18_10195 [Streptococcus mitis]|uniref:Uncharacterized protein n=1 Tax=Streptococcus mitis TaxID=28037 RepID=A0A2I1YXL5_STRMT|nr:hypothetical protein CYK18_10195 [Streptococcus mitis]